MQENIDFSKQPGKVYIKNAKTNNKNKPIISIVTAYYNAQEYIMQTAYSIFNQTFKNWEWIIVNDGSTSDMTYTILNTLKSLDERIRIISQENSGPALARDNGIKNAKADYVCILDSDDLLDKTFLECAYWSLITNPQASWSYSDLIAFGEDEYTWAPKFDVKREKVENLLPSVGLIKKQAIIDAGGYGCYITEFHEDWKLWLLLLKYNNVPVRMSYYGFWYRRRGSGRLKTIIKDTERRKTILNKLKILADDIDESLEGVNFPVIEDNYVKPIDVDYKDIISKDDDKKDIVFFVTKLNECENNKQLLNFFLKQANSNFNFIIITTEPCQYEMRQDFESVATVYDLTSFIAQKYWFFFIEYLLNSREIKEMIFIDNKYSIYFTPMLKGKVKCIKCEFDKSTNSFFDSYFDMVCDINNLNACISNFDFDRNFLLDFNKFFNLSCLELFKDKKKMIDICNNKDEFIEEVKSLYEKKIREITEEKDVYINEQNKIINDKDNIILKQNQIISEKDNLILKKDNLISEKDKELLAIHCGKTYIIANKLSNTIKKVKKIINIKEGSFYGKR